MALYTPKNHPWIPTTGYETVDAYKVLSHPVTYPRERPCYVPESMRTAPLRFPSVAVGYERNPGHAARAALATRYDAEKWFENQKSIREEVEESLKATQPVRENLENLVREVDDKKKPSLKVDPEAKRMGDCLKSKVDQLSSELEKNIIENSKMQDCKRTLQACIQNIEAPRQISQECLHHRESRYKNDLVNDKVEQMLMKEVAVFPQCQKQLEKCLEICDNQLLQGRKMQNDLESLIRSIQWVIFVNRSDQEIKRFYESNVWKVQPECLLKKSNTILNGSKNMRRRIDTEIYEAEEEMSKAWNETTQALVERINQMKEAKTEIKKYLVKIKNEIFNVEKNLKYLKTNKEFYDELQQGKDQLESLLRTKRNLESELSSKINSLFIDEHKCMTLRKCFPISITTKH